MKLSSWVLAALVLGVGCSATKNDSSTEDNETQGEEDKDDPSAPAADFVAQRSYPAAQLPLNAFSDAAQQWATLAARSSLKNGLVWQQLGPAPLDLTGGQLPNATPGSGRATAIAIHPTSPA